MRALASVAPLLLASLLTAACWQIQSHEGEIIQCQHQPHGRWDSETKRCDTAAPDPWDLPAPSPSSAPPTQGARDAASADATDTSADAAADAAADVDADADVDQ